jgi:hypothetical protein
MMKITALSLLSGFLLSCGSSGGGGGGGGVTEATANQRYADSYCAAAFRCKDGSLGMSLLQDVGSPKDQATCSTTVKAAIVQANGKDSPCRTGLYFDPVAGQKCLDLLPIIGCSNISEYNAACDNSVVCKTTPPAGGGTGGISGTGGSTPGTGGSTPPGSGGTPGTGDPCDNCVEQKCSAEVNACFNSTACANLVNCGNNCAGNTTCLQNCASANQSGIGALQALANCLDTKCTSECQ